MHMQRMKTLAMHYILSVDLSNLQVNSVFRPDSAVTETGDSSVCSSVYKGRISVYASFTMFTAIVLIHKYCCWNSFCKMLAVRRIFCIMKGISEVNKDIMNILKEKSFKKLSNNQCSMAL